MEIYSQLIEEKIKMDLENLDKQIKELENLIKEKKRKKAILTDPKEALRDKIDKTKLAIKEIIEHNNVQEIASDYKKIRIEVDKSNIMIRVDLTEQQKEILQHKSKKENKSIVKLQTTNNDM